MATVYWPTHKAFTVSQYALGSATNKSRFEGFLDAEIEEVSHLSDRFTVRVDMPPCIREDAYLRSAFLRSVDSSGDLVSFALWKRPTPEGTLRGSPTVATSALAAARSFAIAGATSGANLLVGGGFEVDANTNNLADGWSTYTSGSVTGGVAEALVAGNGSPLAQRMYAAVLGSTSADQFGLLYASDIAVTAGSSYAWAVDVRSTSGGGAVVRLMVVFLSAGLSVLGSSAAETPVQTTWARRSVVGVAPPTSAYARVYAWMQGDPVGSPIALELDNAQFEQAAAPTAFAGSPTLVGGDILSIGGNLLEVAYPGVTLNDMGTGTVPLSLPLQRAITSGNAVVWSAPAGLWRLISDGIDIDYGPAAVQKGVSLFFKQKVV